ncbi:dihydrolipoamide acetyltransferase family protein [Gaiella sp.]|uniref:dihydrolipoamide acetyltransferase family protein n=1 Tax=Gaiella sp. TaxID=2663207 RepID=UPI00326365F4
MTAVTLAQLSISMEDGRVSRWLVADGELVSTGQPVVEIETDKATIEIEAPVDGVVRIVAAEGDIVVVDGILAELEPATATTATAPADGRAVLPDSAPLLGESVAPQGLSTATSPRRSGPIASPAARRLAREQAVDLRGVSGSGPGGRIVARDIAAVGAAPTTSVAPDAQRLREAVVGNITASWQQIPHVHIGGELAAGGLVQAREILASSGLDVTVTDLLIVAIAQALVEVPDLNGRRLTDGSVERSTAVHLALAVATENGVVAPVLRNADSLAVSEVTRERRRLVDVARSGVVEGRDLVGGTCTLSNLGAYPVDFFAPVVSGPQIAMIATGRVAEKVVAENGWLGVRPSMWVNVAIDHRASDGEAGGRLLAALERHLTSLAEGLS